MRELVGEDGEAIIKFMIQIMTDNTARDADRIEAAKWLGDRGFGRSIQGIDLDLNSTHGFDLTQLSTEDIEAMIAILDKYEPEVRELATTGEIQFAPSLGPGN